MALAEGLESAMEWSLDQVAVEEMVRPVLMDQERGQERLLILVTEAQREELLI